MAKLTQREIDAAMTEHEMIQEYVEKGHVRSDRLRHKEKKYKRRKPKKKDW